MESCFIKNCPEDGTEYVDATMGPIGDFRNYCPKHLAEFKVQDEKNRLERNITYQKSVVENLQRKLSTEIDKLNELIG